MKKSELAETSTAVYQRATASECARAESVSEKVPKGILVGVAKMVMGADGYTLVGTGEGIFDLVFQKGARLAFVKISQESGEFAQDRSLFNVDASEWAGFVAIAAATARELGLDHEVTASLEELKVIVGRDGKAYTQRILGKHPLGAINIAA